MGLDSLYDGPPGRYSVKNSSPEVEPTPEKGPETEPPTTIFVEVRCYGLFVTSFEVEDWDSVEIFYIGDANAIGIIVRDINGGIWPFEGYGFSVHRSQGR